ncbi:MAG: cyclic nucleotide-binding domain-containing protein [Pseudomonadota bacterium]
MVAQNTEDTFYLPEGLKGGQLVDLPAGTRVFQAGDACTQFFYLIEGAIRVDLITKGGRAIMLYRFGADETCILTTSCLLSGDKYCAEAHTESDVKAYIVPFSSFEVQLNQSEEFRRLVFFPFLSVSPQ